MKLYKTKIWFISEHSYTKVLEYYVDISAKSINLNMCMSMYVSVDASTLEPAEKKGKNLPMAFLRCPSSMPAMEDAPT